MPHNLSSQGKSVINGQTVLAIIPARAGSKRLPGKNMRVMHGKPLILWTVEEALKSQYIDSLIVSTDDKDVVQTVKPFPLQIIDRPTHLAADESSIYDGIFHALEYFEPHDWIILLQVTSPLRLVDDIDNAIKICSDRNAPSCISITENRPDANGAVYIAWTTWLRETNLFDTGRVTTYGMPKGRSVDIDHMEDFLEAERLISSRPSSP